jgi:hypothetical protein
MFQARSVHKVFQQQSTIFFISLESRTSSVCSEPHVNNHDKNYALRLSWNNMHLSIWQFSHPSSISKSSPGFLVQRGEYLGLVAGILRIDQLGENPVPQPGAALQDPASGQHRTKLGHVVLRHHADLVIILVGIEVLIRLMAAQDQTRARHSSSPSNLEIVLERTELMVRSVQHRTKLGHVVFRHHANLVIILVGIEVLIRLVAAQHQTQTCHASSHANHVIVMVRIEVLIRRIAAQDQTRIRRASSPC